MIRVNNKGLHGVFWDLDIQQRISCWLEKSKSHYVMSSHRAGVFKTTVEPDVTGCF